jgi:APA family basic amino acid/polyamine antiporter
MTTKSFVRDATGLIKEYGPTDFLLFASAAVFALVFTTTQFPWFYGNTLGANLPLSLLLAAIPFIFLMVAYLAIGVVMPRSGSDYVWVSRVFHPAVGFTWSLFYMFSVFYVAYVGGVFAFSYAFSTALTVLGLISSNTSLTSFGSFLGGSLGSFYLAVVFTLIFGLFAVFGSKFVKGLLYVCWAIAIIGIGLMWYILSTSTPTVFAAKWDSLLGSLGSGVSYNALYSTNSSSFPGVATGTAAIVGALPLASLFLLGGNYVNAAAGELKNVKRSIPIALFLSLLFGILYWSVTSALTLGAVGSNWITVVGHGWDSNPNGYGLPFPPSQPLMLAVIAYPNTALIEAMLFTYLAGSVATMFTYFWLSTKYFFAWSFDRVLPSRFASVSERFHTPYVATVAMVIIGILLSALYALLGWSTAFTLGTVMWDVAFIVPGAAIAVFPFVRRDLFSSAPGWISKKLLGLPVVSLVGFVTAVLFAWLGYIAYTDPVITTPTTLSFEVAAGIIVLGLIIYFASATYHKRRGLDIYLAFKQIPPD